MSISLSYKLFILYEQLLHFDICFMRATSFLLHHAFKFLIPGCIEFHFGHHILYL